MFILAGKLPLWLVLIFIYSVNTITLSQAQLFIHHICGNTNYTRNSTYKNNLDITLSVLPTTNSGFGFINHSIGQGIDTVNSIALCRGDVNRNECQSCLNNSIVNARQLCPNQKEATVYYNVWYDFCLLKYSNQTILGKYSNQTILGGDQQKPYLVLANPQDASDKDQFNDTLRPLLNDLIAQAAAGDSLRKFATGNRTGPDHTTIYGLVQCSPDLLNQQCNDCLNDVINQFSVPYSGKIGGRTLLPMCNFRYEIYPFFNVTTLAIPPPPSSLPAPPPNLQVSPPSQGKNTSRARIVIILTVIVIVSAMIIITSICIFRKLRKKQQQTPQTINTETESMDIGTPESLQYNFALVKAATNNFSEENKLGQGGFGAVYKIPLNVHFLIGKNDTTSSKALQRDCYIFMKIHV